MLSILRGKTVTVLWRRPDMSRDKRCPTMCDQQRLTPACTYAQSDQSLCQSLEYSMSVKLLTKHHLEFLSLKGGCTCLSESTLVEMPHCWKSHVTAPSAIYHLDLVTTKPVFGGLQTTKAQASLRIRED